VGGAGNDTYLVDDVSDKVMENDPSTDVDQVINSITYTLGATVENLFLFFNGANIDGTGNGLNNDIRGNNGDNVLSGLAGADTIQGDTGNDLLLGGDGNDILTLQGGSDTAVGGAGSDLFQYDNTTLNGIDVIADFNGGPGGDVIDLRHVSQFDFATDNINDFLKASTVNGNTTIQADVDGTGNAFAFVDVVVLEGVSTDLAGLLTTATWSCDAAGGQGAFDFQRECSYNVPVGGPTHRLGL
jgi:Ca2+-binding RTX toxin-like protein